jgi:hypothetical protein
MKSLDPAPCDAGSASDCESEKSGEASQLHRLPTPFDEWLEISMRNMRRMTEDEAYRLSIARHLS